jgi:hypothetical protein
MKAFGTSLLMLAAVLGLWAQDAAQDAGAKGKGKAPAKGKDGAAKAGKGKAAAEPKPPAPPAMHQVLRLMRPSMYLVTGHGANTVFRVAPEGVIVVNTKQSAAGDYERLVELIQGVTKAPVKLVLNSSAKPDAAGNNSKFQVAGAEIVGVGRTVKVGTAEVRTIAFGENIAIHFPADHVLYLGELGSSAAALDALLALDWTLAVPATGEPVYRSAVEALRKTAR